MNKLTLVKLNEASGINPCDVKTKDICHGESMCDQFTLCLIQSLKVIEYENEVIYINPNDDF